MNDQVIDLTHAVSSVDFRLLFVNEPEVVKDDEI